MARAFFISGIDTDCGKTFITGHIAKNLHKKGYSVITQKLVQTGCERVSEDIVAHRNIMEIPLQHADINGTTCPYNFPFPASPHFAAQLAQTPINTSIITQSSDTLLQHYEIVLIETAGGLCVPLSNTLLCCDYIAQQGHEVILITSSKLGSINHCLLSLNLCKQLNIPLYAVVYNIVPNSNKAIALNTMEFLQTYIRCKFPTTHFVTSEDILNGNVVITDNK
ncbi:MAG: dethiobiotin synthase [Bacteroidales bacterium]|jgi:dethiobiotin synthetase|nr:dethiobiotin synthase [Bacteroidales bacterium]